MSSEPKGISPKEAKYTVRLRGLFFPIDFRDMRKALEKHGYELSPIRGPIPGRPIRISFGGDIARKGESIVFLDTSESIISVRGDTLSETMKGIDEFSEVVQGELGIDLNSNVWYYEIGAHFLCVTEVHPIKELAKITEGNPFFAKFAEVLKREVSMFSVRLSPPNRIPNQEDWFDISVEQDILVPNAYHIGVVFRNPQKTVTEEFAANLEDRLLMLIDIIEGKK